MSHAYLRDMFLEFIEKTVKERVGLEDALLDEETGKEVSLNTIIGQLWDCTDIMPGSSYQVVEDLCGGDREIQNTYAGCARALKNYLAVNQASS